MSQQHLDRYDILKRLLRKEINGTYAADLLGLSIRQTKRLKRRVKICGAQGLVHGNTGKESHNLLPEKERRRIIDWLHRSYADFGPTFAAEKLSEDHEIHRSAKTIRSIMMTEGLWKPKRKQASTHRQWRQRKEAYGEMIQFDGSYEYWFEDRGGKACLLAGIDDATGTVPSAQFDEHEGVFPVFSFWEEYMIKHGKPRSIYLDKFSTYHMNHPTAKENPDTLTQFQRAMEEFHIEVITAHSPQAKGRIERLFQTFQDRLIKELRLKNISTTHEANRFLTKTFLPKFNRRFGVTPRTDGNLHRQLSQKERDALGSTLCRHTKRVVQNDFTVSFRRQWYQLTKEQSVTICPKDTVIIEEYRDHSIGMKLRGKYLNFRLLPERPKKVAPRLRPWVLAASTQEKASAPLIQKPAADHPWRTAIHLSIVKRQLSKV